MRRLASLTAALCLTLSLSACSSNTDADQSAQSASADSVEVDRSGKGNFPKVDTHEFGQDPTIEAGKTDDFTTVAVKTLHEGDGAEITAEDTVLVNYELALWDGTKIESSFESGTPASFRLNQVIPGWTHGLAGQHVGDRVQIVIPSQWGYGDVAQGSIPAGSTLVFVVDLIDSSSSVDPQASFLKDAKRTDETLVDGLTVSEEAGVEPTIEYAEAAAVPTDQSVVTFLKGTGQSIGEDDYVLYRVVSSLFGDASTQQSTWGTTLGSMPAHQEGAPITFDGQTVGSRLVIVSPVTGAADGSQSAQAPAASVAVVDIVGILSANK